MNLFLICFVMWSLIGIGNILNMLLNIFNEDNEKCQNRIVSYLINYTTVWILLLLEYANRLGWIK